MSFAGSLSLLACNRDLCIYRNFEGHELSYEQWKSVLHLSTRWGFASLRKLALKSIRPPTSHDQLVLARTYSVKEWVLPALTALCSKSLPLSLDEARQMDIEDVILVATVREEIRGGALRVDAADIQRHVEMAQSNGLVSKIYSFQLENGSTRQELGSRMDPVSKLGDPPEDIHTREHLTVTTEVPVPVHMATAGPSIPRPTRPTTPQPTRPTTPLPTRPATPQPTRPTTPLSTRPTTPQPTRPTTPQPTRPTTPLPTRPTPPPPARPTTPQSTTAGPTTPWLTTAATTSPGLTTPRLITPGNSRDGGRNEGEGREGGEKVLEDDQIVPIIMTKDSTSVGAPDVPTPEVDSEIPVKTKKKGGVSVRPPVALCAGCITGDCDCTAVKKKKKGKKK